MTLARSSAAAVEEDLYCISSKKMMQEFGVIHECVTILHVGKCDVFVMKTVLLVVA